MIKISSIKKEHEKPIKRLGQNFLLNDNALDKIISTSNISPGEKILEVGPGTGILTERLIYKKAKIVAVEKDYNLCILLKKKFCYDNLEIINENILNFQIEKMGKDYKVVANIPYYITSSLIKKLLERENQPKKIVLTIQKEVAKRICSSPPNMNILSLSVQYYAKAKIVGNISKGSFWPPPKIESSIIEIIPFNHFTEESKFFFRIVKAGFSSPRKKVLNNLFKKLNIEKKYMLDFFLKNNYNETIRAEELSLSDWVNIKNFLKPKY